MASNQIFVVDGYPQGAVRRPCYNVRTYLDLEESTIFRGSGSGSSNSAAAGGVQVRSIAIAIATLNSMLPAIDVTLREKKTTTLTNGGCRIMLTAASKLPARPCPT